MQHAAAVDVIESLGELSAPFQALAEIDGRVVVVEVGLEVAVAGFAEEDTLSLETEMSGKTINTLTFCTSSFPQIYLTILGCWPSLSRIRRSAANDSAACFCKL